MKGSPLCEVVERCGGCPWLLFAASEEQQRKVTLARDLITNLGVTNVALDFVTSGERTGYRNRIRLRIDEQGGIGYFNTGKSLDCAVLRPALTAFVNRLRDWAAVNLLQLANFAHVEARTCDEDGHWGLFLTYRADAPEDISVTAQLARDLGSVLVATDRDTCMPQQRFAHHEGGFLFVPLNGFVQVNPAINRQLVEHVVHGALTHRWSTFVDLYGGAGNFALALVRAGLSGVLIERNPACIQAASHSIRAQGLLGLQLQTADAITACRSLMAGGTAHDAVIVDPPRAGVQEGLDVVLALAKSAIVYCSCNPATLERDLRVLLSAGWTLQRLVGFDMFPGTRHLEAVAWLAPR
jgi:23S rRNA (uracil1939-C5)-methyltransferase